MRLIPSLVFVIGKQCRLGERNHAVSYDHFGVDWTQFRIHKSVGFAKCRSLRPPEHGENRACVQVANAPCRRCSFSEIRCVSFRPAVSVADHPGCWRR
jgi:hypothetical protein